jgi:hypothetical protein
MFVYYFLVLLFLLMKHNKIKNCNKLLLQKIIFRYIVYMILFRIYISYNFSDENNNIWCTESQEPISLVRSCTILDTYVACWIQSIFNPLPQLSNISGRDILVSYISIIMHSFVQEVRPNAAMYNTRSSIKTSEETDGRSWGICWGNMNTPSLYYGRWEDEKFTRYV